MPPLKKPQLTNRGAAGLLTSIPDYLQQDAKALEEVSKEAAQKIIEEAPKNKIVPSLRSFAVPIASLTPDPMNARIHPERNIESIKLSLARYGQRKVIAVRKQGMVVAAGNGTLEAAKQLGWTKIAASVEPMTDEEFYGYALADNRTAELARWDIHVVAKLDQLIRESKDIDPIGWTADELVVLRTAFPDGYVPPPVSDETFTQKPKLSLQITEEEKATVERAIGECRNRLESSEENGQKITDGHCLEIICLEWLGEDPNATAEKTERAGDDNGEFDMPF